METLYLTEEDLLHMSPSIGATEGAAHTSEKYVHVPTMKVVRDLKQLGWFPVKTFQLNTRAAGRKGYQKHMIVFQDPTFVPLDGHIPEIVMTNSHDGKSTFRFETGLFDTISLRRYVLALDDFGSAKIRHMYYSFVQIQKAIRELVEFIPELFLNIEKLKGKLLEGNDVIELRNTLMEARFLSAADEYTLDDSSFKCVPYSNLWDTYMEMHGLIQNGGILYSTEKSRKNKTITLKKSAGVKNFYRMVKISKKVWAKINSI